MSKQKSKELLISTIQDERRAMSTMKREDKTQRLTSVASRSELLSKSRLEESERHVNIKDLKIQEVRSNVMKSRSELRTLKSASRSERHSFV